MLGIVAGGAPITSSSQIYWMTHSCHFTPCWPTRLSLTWEGNVTVLVMTRFDSTHWTVHATQQFCSFCWWPPSSYKWNQQKKIGNIRCHVIVDASANIAPQLLTIRLGLLMLMRLHDWRTLNGPTQVLWRFDGIMLCFSFSMKFFTLQNVWL